MRAQEKKKFSVFARKVGWKLIECVDMHRRWKKFETPPRYATAIHRHLVDQITDNRHQS